MLNKFILASPLAIAMCLSAPAYAQTETAEAQDANPTDTASATQVPAGEEQVIVVTATKREQNLQDVPVAVTAVSELRLQSLNVVSVAELTNVAPSLNYNQTTLPGSSQFIIRGIGTYAFNEGLEPSVGVVVDGIPLGRSTGAVADAVDLAQVQVLRGPQGTIFGKNATAGVIALDFRNAEFNETSFTGRAFVGSNEEFRVQGTVNVPVVADTVALRVTAWDFRRDGYIRAPMQPDGDVGDFHNQGARLKVALRPMQDLRVDLTGEISRNTADGTPQTQRGYSNIDVIQPFDQALGIVAGPNNLTSGVEAPLSARLRQYRFTGRAVYDLDGASITALAGYFNTRLESRSDTDTVNSTNIPQPGLAHYFGNIEQFTTELRIASEGSGDLQYTAGLFYYDLSVHRNEHIQNSRFVAPFTASDGVVDVNTKNYAAFADLSYDLGPIRLLAGGRYSIERTSGSYVRGPSLEYGAPVTLNGPLNVVNPAHQYEDFSWRVGAQYRPAEDIMFYVTASRGYKGPGLNYTLSLTPAQFAINSGIIEAEIAHSYEVGMRAQFLDRQLTFNLTGFYSPFTNFQVTAALPTNPTTFSTVNAGELLAKGIELEFAARPDFAPGFTIDGSVVYNDTRYEDFENAPCFIGQVPVGAPTSEPGVCAPIVAGGTVRVQNVSGLRAVGAPEWQVNITPRYEREIGSGYRAFGQAHFQYNSEIQYAVGNNPVTIQRPYHTIDLTAGFGAADRSWTLSAYARNIEDNRFVSRIAYTGPGIGQLVPYQALRTFGIALDVRF